MLVSSDYFVNTEEFLKNLEKFLRTKHVQVFNIHMMP